MNKKEIAEIRRRYTPEKNGFTVIRGCYVNDQREIISTFESGLTLMPENEGEKYLAIFRRTLSGIPGRNLTDMEFSTTQVTDGEEHMLLTALRTSALKDDAAVDTFFRKVIDSLTLEGNYLILLAHDAYDMPTRASDGEKIEDGSTQVFNYILCSVCPVKLAKPALSYHADENEFHNRPNEWIVTAPELGFIFPAFNDRAADIYDALYYTRDTAEIHTDFTDAIFNTAAPMPPAAQRDAFRAVLGETLAEECSYDIVTTVTEQLRDMMDEHDADKSDPEPLAVKKNDVKALLESAGVQNEKLAAFDESFDREFGKDADLNPANLVDVKALEVRTPDVVIKVAPDRSDLIETRVIDGVQYVLIRAEGGVEVNGVTVSITADKKSEN